MASRLIACDTIGTQNGLAIASANGSIEIIESRLPKAASEDLPSLYQTMCSEIPFVAGINPVNNTFYTTEKGKYLGY